MNKIIDQCQTADDLLMEIVKCGFSCESSNSPCHSIWESQKCGALGDFHLPEPWNGDIENAQLMFLGINPRHNAGELFPRTGHDWWMQDALLNRERIIDFFKNRFSSEHQYVRGLPQGPVRVKLETMGYRKAGGVYWRYLHMIARLVLGNGEDAGSISPGREYVLSEVVHCKTLNEQGVSQECFECCRKTWLTKMMRCASKVKYIVVVGGSAKERVAPIFLLSNPCYWKWYSVKWNGHDYKVMFVYHSNAHRSYFESLRDIFNANKKEGIGISKWPNDLDDADLALQETPVTTKKQLYQRLWNGFSGWCEENKKSWFTRSVDVSYDANAIHPSGMGDPHLFFKVNNGKLYLGIYCTVATYGEIHVKCATQIHSINANVDWTNGEARKTWRSILLPINADLGNISDDLFERMGRDYESVRDALSRNGFLR